MTEFQNPVNEILISYWFIDIACDIHALNFGAKGHSRCDPDRKQYGGLLLYTRILTWLVDNLWNYLIFFTCEDWLKYQVSDNSFLKHLSTTITRPYCICCHISWDFRSNFQDSVNMCETCFNTVFSMREARYERIVFNVAGGLAWKSLSWPLLWW